MMTIVQHDIDELQKENKILVKQYNGLRSTNINLQEKLTEIKRKIDVLNQLNDFVVDINIKNKETLSSVYNEILDICNREP